MRVETRKRAVTVPGAHSTVVGGSSAKLRLECSASRIEEQGMPSDTSIYADTGTALHHVVETAIVERLSDRKILDRFLGVALKIDDMQYTVDLTQELLTKKAFPAVNFFEDTVPLSAQYHVEKKVGWQHAHTGFAEGMDEIEGAFGTADILYSDKRVAGGIDWKFGDGRIVEEETGKYQAQFYLVGAIMNGLLPVRDHYEWWFFQPAEGLDPEQYALRLEFTWEELVAFNNDLVDALTMTPVYRTGAHCKACKGKHGCHAFKQMLGGVQQTDVAGLSNKDLGHALDMLPAILEWCKEVKEIAKRNAQAGIRIPGWKLAPVIGDRQWKDPIAAEKALARLGVDHKARVISKVISAPQAVDLLKKMGTPDKQLDRFTVNHIHRPENGEKLVKASPEEVEGQALTALGTALAARGM